MRGVGLTMMRALPWPVGLEWVRSDEQRMTSLCLSESAVLHIAPKSPTGDQLSWGLVTDSIHTASPVTCMEESAFQRFLHSFIHFFALICHLSVWCLIINLLVHIYMENYSYIVDLITKTLHAFEASKPYLCFVGEEILTFLCKSVIAESLITTGLLNIMSRTLWA